MSNYDVIIDDNILYFNPIQTGGWGEGVGDCARTDFGPL